MLAHEVGVADRLEIAPTDAWRETTDLVAELSSERPHLGAIALACAHGYLDLRGTAADSVGTVTSAHSPPSAAERSSASRPP